VERQRRSRPQRRRPRDPRRARDPGPKPVGADDHTSDDVAGLGARHDEAGVRGGDVDAIDGRSKADIDPRRASEVEEGVLRL